MTYFGVLLRFIVPMLLLLVLINVIVRRRGARIVPDFRTWSPWAVVFAHVLIALAYTTPWDNYLVATRVWWYDPDLVTGITLGYVPIEEYTFFVVQTLLSGLWLLLCMRYVKVPSSSPPSNKSLRWGTVGGLGVLWLAWLILFLLGWTPGLYMALILVWIIPPIGLQLAFGADVLYHYRRLVLWGLLPPFLYLCLVDAIAIHSGTWTINPDKILGLYLGGVLPLEEATFFLVTNVVVVFGMVLMLAQESHARLDRIRSRR